jgi:hypothetical protein
MDSPHNPHSAGGAMEFSGALTPSSSPATELAISFVEFSVAIQLMSVLHSVVAWFFGAVLLPHGAIPGAWLFTQGAIHTSQSVERQSGGSDFDLLSASVPVPTLLCCHHSQY